MFLCCHYSVFFWKPQLCSFEIPFFCCSVKNEYSPSKLRIKKATKMYHFFFWCSQKMVYSHMQQGSIFLTLLPILIKHELQFRFNLITYFLEQCSSSQNLLLMSKGYVDCGRSTKPQPTLNCKRKKNRTTKVGI